MRKVKNQRLPLGSTMKIDRHRSSMSAERGIRRPSPVGYLKSFGSRPESRRFEVRRAA